MLEIAKEKVDWLFGEAKRIVNAARRMPPVGGIWFYHPDGSGNYRGVWSRDFAYIVDNVPELVPPKETKAIYYLFLKHQRPNGGLPANVSRELTPGYCCVASEAVKDFATDADNSQFAVKIVYDYYKQTGDVDLFAATMTQLKRAMDFVPRSSLGLVWIDPDYPHTGYGFTDLVVKTGNELFTSVLYWEACRCFAELADKTGEKEMAQSFLGRAHKVETNINVLWDEKAGAFFATDLERKIDIWGNAYLVNIGFPIGDKLQRLLDFLVTNYDNYTYAGQVRHLPQGEHWSHVIYEVPKGTYQHGAYWGTASGWVAYALSRKEPKLASAMLNDMIDYYQQEGVYECVNKQYTKVKDYVASITNPVGAIKRILGIASIREETWTAKGDANGA